MMHSHMIIWCKSSIMINFSSIKVYNDSAGQVHTSVDVANLITFRFFYCIWVVDCFVDISLHSPGCLFLLSTQLLHQSLQPAHTQRTVLHFMV